MKKQISPNQSGFKKNFYQIFPKSSTMNKNNLQHSRDLSSDFSLTEKKYGIEILNDNYYQSINWPGHMLRCRYDTLCHIAIQCRLNKFRLGARLPHQFHRHWHYQ